MSNEARPSSGPVRLSARERLLAMPTQQDLNRSDEAVERTSVFDYRHKDPEDQYSDLIVSTQVRDTPFTRVDSGALQQALPQEAGFSGEEGRWMTAEEIQARREEMEREAEEELLAELALEQEASRPGHGISVRYTSPDGGKVTVKAEGVDEHRVQRIVESFIDRPQAPHHLGAVAARGYDAHRYSTQDPVIDRYYETADRAEIAAYDPTYNDVAPASFAPTAPQEIPLEEVAVVDTPSQKSEKKDIKEVASRHKKLIRFGAFAAAACLYRPVGNMVHEFVEYRAAGESISAGQLLDVALGKDIKD